MTIYSAIGELIYAGVFFVIVWFLLPFLIAVLETLTGWLFGALVWIYIKTECLFK